MTKRILNLLTVLVMAVSLAGVLPAVNVGAANGLVWPVPGHTSLSQGYHSGYCIDISDSNIAGANIVAAKSGTVYAKYTCGSQHYGSKHTCDGFGTGIIIKGDDGRYYGYAHMQANSIPSSVYKGAYVSAGSKIGQVGKTGNATGNHLHFYCGTSAWKGNIQISKSASDYGSGSVSAPTFGTPYTTSVGENSAYIKCSISKNGSNWSQVGAYYGTSTSSMVKAGSDNLGSGNTWAGYTLSNLKSGTTYYYKFYITANGTTYYSSVQSFKTKTNAPTFGTLKHITSSNSAYIECTINANNTNVTSIGAYYGTSTSNMTKVDSENLFGSDKTSAGYTLLNLKYETTYYYKFYAVANGTTYYSSVQSFKTLQKLTPTLGTPYTISVGSDYADVRCDITKNGSNWTQVGVYYGTSTSSMTIARSASLDTIQGTWPIIYTLSNLKAGTTYYYKYYVVANSGITYYSSVQSFKTTGNTPHTHSYTSTVVAPTCTSQGYTLHKCSCGTSYKDKYTSATGHKYSNGVCKVCGAKDSNYIEPTKRSPYLEFSDKTITLNVNEIKTIGVSVKGDLPKFSVKYICDSKKVSCSWSKKWSNHSTQINIKGVKAGVHQVRIELYNSNTKELLSTNTIQVIVNNPTSPSIHKEVTNLAKVKAVKIKANKKRLNVSWKKVSGATGYEVKFSFKTNYITIDWSSKFTKKKSYKCKIKHWANGERVKKYMFKVRAFKKINGNTSYGNWSKVVKKKIR